MATDLDLDTFLATAYCAVDELYVERSRRSERAFVRYVARCWQAYFAWRLNQSVFNRRARDLR